MQGHAKTCIDQSHNTSRSRENGGGRAVSTEQSVIWLQLLDDESHSIH